MTTEPADYNIYPEDQEWLRKEEEALTFADILRSHRLCEEWTQEQAARKLGITKQMLSAYENGHKIPSAKRAYEIGERLGIVPGLAVIHALNDQLREDALPIKIQQAC